MGELVKKKFVVVIVVIAILLSLFATVVLVLNFLVFAFPDFLLLPFFDRMMTSSRPGRVTREPKAPCLEKEVRPSSKKSLLLSPSPLHC